MAELHSALPRRAGRRNHNDLALGVPAHLPHASKDATATPNLPPCGSALKYAVQQSAASNAAAASPLASSSTHLSCAVQNAAAALLSETPLMQSLGDSCQHISQTLSAHMKHAEYPDGAPILQPQQGGSVMFLILSGSAVLYANGTATTYSVGSVINEVELFYNTPREHKVFAVAKVEALQLSRVAFNKVVEKEAGAGLLSEYCFGKLKEIVYEKLLGTGSFRAAVAEQDGVRLVEECVAGMRQVSFPKGTTLTPTTSFHLIMRGRTRVSEDVAGGDTSNVYTLCEGSVFGEDTLLSDLPDSTTVTTLTHTQMWVLDRATTKTAMLNHPKSAARLDEVSTRFLEGAVLPRLLLKLPFLSPLRSETLHKLAFSLQKRVFCASEIIQNVKEEDISFEHAAIILKGELLVEAIGEDGETTLRDGDSLNSLAVLYVLPRQHKVTVVKESTLFCLEKDAFWRIIKESETESATQQMQAIAERLHRTTVLFPIILKIPLFSMLAFQNNHALSSSNMNTTNTNTATFINDLIDKTELVEVANGVNDDILSGDDDGIDDGRLIIVISGFLDIFERDANRTYVSTVQDGGSYGHLSLLEPTPRTTRLVARRAQGAPCVYLMCLTKDAFSKLLKETPSAKAIRSCSWMIFQSEVLFALLRTMKVFEGCSRHFLHEVVKLLKLSENEPDSYIGSEGTPGFFVLLSRGNLSVRRNGVDAQPIRDGGNCGALNLFCAAPRTTSVFVEERSVYFTLHAEDLVGMQEQFPKDMKLGERNSIELLQAEIVQVLAKDGLFCVCNEATLRKVAELFCAAPTKTYPAGADIVKVGEGGESMLFVCQGKVDVFLGTKHHAVLNDGDMYGGPDLFFRNVRVFRIAAKHDVILMELSADTLKHALQQPQYLDDYTRIRQRASETFLQVTLTNLVRLVPVLSAVSQEAAQAVSQRMVHSVHKKGDVVVETGCGGKEALFVYYGSVNVTRYGETSVVHEAGSVGEVALFFPMPRNFRVVANEDTEMYSLSREAYVEEIGRFPRDARLAENTGKSFLEMLFFRFLREDSQLFYDCTNTDDFVRDVVPLLQQRFYKKGEVLTQFGDCTGEMIFVSRGALTKATRAYGRTTTEHFKDGDFCSEAVLVFGIPRLYEITADADSFCLVLRLEDFTPIMEKHGRRPGLLDLKLHYPSLKDSVTAIPLFRKCGLSQTEYDLPTEVIAALQLKQYKKGDKIVEFGEVFDFLCIVARGEVVVEDRFSLQTLQDGAVFGYVEVLHDLPRVFKIHCAKDTSLLILSREHLKQIMEKKPVEAKLVSDEAANLYYEALAVYLRHLDSVQLLLQKADGVDSYGSAEVDAFLFEAAKCFDLREYTGSGEASKRYVCVEHSAREEALYLILQGSLTLVEKDRALIALKDGDAAQETALMFKSPRVISLRIEETTRIFVLSQQKFTAVLDTVQNPALHKDIKASLTHINRRNILQRLLKSTYLFHSCNEAFLVSITEVMTEESIKKGGFLAKADHVGDGLIFVNQGSLELSERNQDGELKSSTLVDGEHFGEISLIYKTVQGANLVALEDTTLYRLCQQDFRRILGKFSAEELEVKHLAKIKYYHIALFHMIRAVPFIASTRCYPFIRELAFRLSMRVVDVGGSICQANTTATYSRHDDSLFCTSVAMENSGLEKFDLQHLTKGREMLFIDSGSVEMTRDRHVESTLLSNSWFGAVRLFYDAPRLHTLTAKSKTTIFALERTAFNEVLAMFPALIPHMEASGHKLLSQTVYQEMCRLRKQPSSVFARCTTPQHAAFLRDLSAAMIPITGKSGDTAVGKEQDRDCMLFLARGRLQIVKTKPMYSRGEDEADVKEAPQTEPGADSLSKNGDEEEDEEEEGEEASEGSWDDDMFEDSHQPLAVSPLAFSQPSAFKSRLSSHSSRSSAVILPTAADPLEDEHSFTYYIVEGTFFSEISLCECDCPRFEEITFDTDGLLLALKRSDFNAVVAKHSAEVSKYLLQAIRSQYSKTILSVIVSNVALFERCKHDCAFITRVVNALVPKKYLEGDVIAPAEPEDDEEDDDDGNEMHLIVKGTHAAYVGNKAVREYRDESCFGEIALIFHTPRTVQLKCLTDSQHFTLKKCDFQKILNQQKQNVIEDVRSIAETRFEKYVLQDLVKTVPLFVRCRDKQMIREVTELLRARRYNKGDYVISQGEGGDEMFFISRGRLSVEIGGNVVHTLKDGNFFGEIALLYDTPRIASIVALTESYLYSLSNQGFQNVINKYPMEAAWTREIAASRLRKHVLHDIVKKVPIFKNCEEPFLTTVVNRLKPKMFKTDDVIVREGEGGNEMYFISRGELCVLIEGHIVTTMKDGDFFGEIAVVFDTPRTATIISKTTTQVFILTKKDFKKVMQSDANVAAGVAAIAEERFRTQVVNSFLKQVSFFREASDVFRQELAARMKIRYYSRDSVVVQEGEGGDKMYFVSRGALSVRVGRNVVHTMRDGDLFGEVALLYDTPRTATITATANSNLLVLTKTELDNVLEQYPIEAGDIRRLARSRFQQFVLSDMLRKVPFFKTCKDEVFLHEVVERLLPRGYAHKEIVIKEGEGGNEMYFVSRGQLSVSVNDVVVCTLKDGDFFGEVALVYDTPRTATIRVKGRSQLFVLTKQDFAEVMSRYTDSAKNIREIARDRFKQFVLNDLVRKVPLFRTARDDKEFIDGVVDLLRPHMYDVGEPVIQEGEGGESMYFISRGELDVLVAGAKVHLLKDGDVFGEVALIYCTPRTASIIPRTSCLVLELARKDFSILLEKHTGVSSNVHAIAKQRLYTFVLQDIVKKVPLFKNCQSDEFLVDVVRCLEPIGFEAEEYVIHEGEGGDEMYFVSQGDLSVSVGKDVVHTMHDGDFFGEIALIYDTPRTASIFAKTKSQLFVLKKDVLSNIMSSYEEESFHIKVVAKRRFEDHVLNQLVRNVPIFKNCKRPFIDSIVQALLPRKASKGVTLIREGEGGDEMFFISRGELSISIQGRRVHKMKDGDFFGEIALIYDTPRTATIISQTRGNLYVLTRHDFCQVCEKFPEEASFITDVAAERFVVFIRDIVKRNPLFAKCSDPFLQAIVHGLTPKTYERGENVVVEGVGGDEMYFVSRGELEVTINQTKVHTMKDGGYFGEVALVFDIPRTATIAACTETNLFMLTRDVFNAILTEHPDDAEAVLRIAKTRLQGFILSDLVRKVPLFSDTARDLFIRDVVECLEPKIMEEGEPVIQEGEGGDEMYFVSRGELSVTVEGRVVHTVKDGDFFGEVALIYDTPRTASITATSRSQLFFLKKADFQKVMMQYPNERKSIAEIARRRFKQFVLNDLVRKVPLFKGCTDDTFINDIVDLLKPHMYKPTEAIIREGEGGEGMYFVSRGDLDVTVGGKKVHTLRDGDVFGEVALMYSTPRTASITATVHCLVLELTRSDFTVILSNYSSLVEGIRTIAKERLRTFVLQDLVKKVPLFQNCQSDEFLDEVVRLLEPIQFEEEENIIVEGGDGDGMFFVSQGELKVRAAGLDVGVLRDGDFFGEIALVYDTPRTATITTLCKSQLFRLSRSDFTALSSQYNQESLVFKQVAKERFRKVLRVSALLKGAGK